MITLITLESVVAQLVKSGIDYKLINSKIYSCGMTIIVDSGIIHVKTESGREMQLDDLNMLCYLLSI